MKVYTHAGLFHADEVTAYTIIKMCYNSTDVSFNRLTDLSDIPSDGIVVDIGRKYDHTNKLYDHHQDWIPRKNGVPYASAGLIWLHYGKRVISMFTDIDKTEDIDAIHERVDRNLIQGIDAHDADNNYSLKAVCGAGEVRVHSLSNIISSFNSDDVKSETSQYFAFIDAADLVKSIISKEIKRAIKHLETEKKFDDLHETMYEDKVIILKESLPWKEIVHEKYPDALYVIAPSNHPGNPYSMISVPIEPTSR